MLKIKKGIKKKIKGKKEKEEDLFDPASLAKYKKELEESRREKSGGGGGEGNSSAVQNEAQDSASAVGKSEEDDEWKRFKQLTAGIDVTLKKSSGDLDRIKTTSYYQKKVSTTVVEEKKEQWEDVEKEGSYFPQEPNQSLPQTEEDSWGSPLPVQEVKEELKLNEVDQEIEVLDDGLFDTSYLDAIESGEIQLAYIPESPVEELDGDDPFDTSAVADVVKKIHEEEVKVKRKINLGGAVDFYTKKSDVQQAELTSATPYTDKTAEIKNTKRGRPVHVDLLGFNADEENVEGENKPKPSAPNLNSSHQNPGKKGKEEGGFDLTDLIREFETSDAPKPVTSKNILSNLDLLTEPEQVEEAVPKEDEDDVWFQTGNEEVLEPEEKSRRESVEDVDPFDTSVVDKLGFGKAELKILEDELLPTSEEASISVPDIFLPPATGPEIIAEKPLRKEISLDDDFDFDPRKDEPPTHSFHPLDIIHPDSNFDAASLTPQLRNSEEPEEIDPFDTSSVSHIALPGKSELRLLEDELTSSNSVTQDCSPILNSQSFSIPDSEPIIAPSILNPLDAPHVNEILELRHPPLKSQPTLPSAPKELKTFDDPFDTSDVIDAFAPGKNELKELETELLNSTVDFVPPRVCPLRNFKILHHNTSITSVVTERQESLHPFDSIDGDSEVEHHRPLVPQAASGHNCFEDPFDTSGVTAILPGKIEAKLLEEELAAASFRPVLTHAFERNTFSLPPNTAPVPPTSFPIQDFEEEEIDPFDTSIANSVITNN